MQEQREREDGVCVCVLLIVSVLFSWFVVFFLFTPAVSWIRLHTWRRHEAHHVLHFVFFCFAPFYSDAGWSVDFMLFSINSLTDGSSSRQFPIRRWREGDNNIQLVLFHMNEQSLASDYCWFSFSYSLILYNMFWKLYVKSRTTI